MVPRLLSGREARVGEVKSDFLWSAAVPARDVPWTGGGVVLGADVVGGGSAG